MQKSKKMTNAKSYNYYVVKLESPDKFNANIKCIPKEWIREYLKDDYLSFRYPDFKCFNKEIDMNLIAQRVPLKQHWPSYIGHIIFKCATFHTACEFLEQFDNIDDESDNECEKLKYDDDDDEEIEENINIENEEIENSQKATRKRERREENDEQSSKENNKPKIRRLSHNRNKTTEEIDEQNILIVSNNQNPLKMTLSLKRNRKNTKKTCHNQLTMKENPRESLTASDIATLDENAAQDSNTKLHQEPKKTKEISKRKKSVEKAKEVTQTKTQTANNDSNIEQILNIKNGKQNYNVNDVKHVYNTIMESKIKLKNVYDEIRTNLRNAFATVGLDVPEFCDHLIKPMLNTN